MSIFLTIVAFIAIFSILVLVHEWGHFIVARKNGIKVEEFGFGLPPRIWGKRKGETLYSINAIPFGGFVKLLGEDAHDAKMLKNPHSFSSKSIRVRSAVILAGVFMNFILAYVLLTIGFLFGIQPLILNADDVYTNVKNGVMQIQPGIIIKDVKQGGPAQIAGLKAGDVILTINGKKPTSGDDIAKIITTTQKQTLEILQSNGGAKSYDLQAQAGNDVGYSIYEYAFFPRLKIHDVVDTFAKAGLAKGDVIIKLNDREIFTQKDFDEILQNTNELKFMVWREGQIVNIPINLPVKNRVIVNNVFSNTPAENAGLKPGDVITKIGDQQISFPQQLMEVTHKSPNQKLQYFIMRDGKEVQIEIAPDKNGLIGIGLSVLDSFQNKSISLYEVDGITSITKINNIKYGIGEALSKAFSESGRLAVLTIDMFGNVIRSFVTKFTIPEGVAGPVGIAQMTYTFVQEGALSLMRFMALLSLSLAIINVLPFPALDGGRFLFIVIELVLGRRLSAKYESIIHGVGFVILMGLILAVTYSDILKLF